MRDNVTLQVWLDQAGYDLPAILNVPNNLYVQKSLLQNNRNRNCLLSSDHNRLTVL